MLWTVKKATNKTKSFEPFLSFSQTHEQFQFLCTYILKYKIMCSWLKNLFSWTKKILFIIIICITRHRRVGCAHCAVTHIGYSPAIMFEKCIFICYNIYRKRIFSAINVIRGSCRPCFILVISFSRGLLVFFFLFFSLFFNFF